MKFDVAIVVGTGISQEGTLPESCLSNLKTAIKLYKEKTTSKLIFSGKWAWNCKFTPPVTEAKAMKQIAINQGVSDTDIFTEDESVTTVSNLCNLKTKILIPHNYQSVALICISDILVPRMELNLKMVLGSNYTYEIILAESSYTSEKYQELKNIEAKKLIDCQNFYINLIPGDHQTILQKSEQDLQKNYINKTTQL